MPAHRFGRLWKFQVSETDELVSSAGAAQLAPDEKDDT